MLPHHTPPPRPPTFLRSNKEKEKQREKKSFKAETTL